MPASAMVCAAVRGARNTNIFETAEPRSEIGVSRLTNAMSADASTGSSNANGSIPPDSGRSINTSPPASSVHSLGGRVVVVVVVVVAAVVLVVVLAVVLVVAVVVLAVAVVVLAVVVVVLVVAVAVVVVSRTGACWRNPVSEGSTPPVPPNTAKNTATTSNAATRTLTRTIANMAERAPTARSVTIRPPTARLGHASRGVATGRPWHPFGGVGAVRVEG